MANRAVLATVTPAARRQPSVVLRVLRPAIRPALIAAVALATGLVAVANLESFATGRVMAARRAMDTEQFAINYRKCPDCAPDVVAQFAPPGRSMMVSNQLGHDDWPYATIIDGKMFVSMQGTRWTEEPALEHLTLSFSDPRTVLPALDEPTPLRREVISGVPAVTIAGTLNLDRFIDLAPLGTNDDEKAGLRQVLGSAPVTLWIADQTGHVLRMDIRPALEPRQTITIEYDFDMPVSIPATVPIMDKERSAGLGSQSGANGKLILLAIAAYHDAHGHYPATLDPETLGDSFAWPENPFTGGPVRLATNTPGDFEYSTTEDLSHMTFAIHGWDGPALYFDTLSFGPPLTESQRDLPR